MFFEELYKMYRKFFLFLFIVMSCVVDCSQICVYFLHPASQPGWQMCNFLTGPTIPVQDNFILFTYSLNLQKWSKKVQYTIKQFTYKHIKTCHRVKIQTTRMRVHSDLSIQNLLTPTLIVVCKIDCNVIVGATNRFFVLESKV